MIMKIVSVYPSILILYLIKIIKYYLYSYLCLINVKILNQKTIIKTTLDNIYKNKFISHGFYIIVDVCFRILKH